MKIDKEKKIKQKTGLPIARISASAIRDYFKCKKLFYYKYVLRMKLPTKPIQLVFGGAFHHGLEAWYEGKDPTEVFKAEFKASEIDPFDPVKFSEAMDDGIAMMEEWKEKAAALHKEYKISMKGESEKDFANLWFHPETFEKMPIMVNGRYDRITADEDILEFKTSSHRYKQEEVDTTDQGNIYTFSRFLDLKKKLMPRRMIYIVFLKGRKKDRIQVLITNRTKKQYIQAFETVALLLNNLKGRTEADYSYGEGFMHKYCDCKKFEEMLLL